MCTKRTGRQYADEGCGASRYLVQHTSMNEADREAFLEAFALDEKHTTVGFCVMGRNPLRRGSTFPESG